VVRDTGTADRQGDLVDPTPQLFYRSFTQWDLPPSTVLAWTSLDAAGLVGAMQREMRAMNVTLPVMSAKAMAKYLDDSLLTPKAVATFLGGLGAVGVFLWGWRPPTCPRGARPGWIRWWRSGATDLDRLRATARVPSTPPT
jgi:hypothetical protein